MTHPIRFALMFVIAASYLDRFYYADEIRGTGSRSRS